MIISKGSEAITGGISVYAKTIVLNILKDCGLDLRDVTTKSLEAIREQMDIVQTKINAIAAKQELYHDQQILNNVLNEFNSSKNKYYRFFTNGMGYLGELEADESVSEEEAEYARHKFYVDNIEALTFDGSPFATYVQELASKVLQPNAADPNKDIFYYYDNTIASTDKWDIQYYKNIRNFMSFIDSSLVIYSDIAKFQIYYKALNAGEAARRSYAGQIDDMAAAVNAVNVQFQNKLKSLEYIKLAWENRGVQRYIPTGKYYSTRMATLTYNPEDYVYADSRQALILGYKNDKGTHGLLQECYTYHPNQDIIRAVANDFKEYAGDYYTSGYTINDYLKYAGFWAVNDDLFNKAVGLFNGDFYVDQHGFMNHDIDYSTSWYDQHGNYVRKNVYEVDSYYTWYGALKRTVLRRPEAEYYYFLCFGVLDGNWLHLDGQYSKTYMCDANFTVFEQLYFHPKYMDLYQKVGPITYHNCW